MNYLGEYVQTTYTEKGLPSLFYETVVLNDPSEPDITSDPLNLFSEVENFTTGGTINRGSETDTKDIFKDNGVFPGYDFATFPSGESLTVSDYSYGGCVPESGCTCSPMYFCNPPPGDGTGYACTETIRFEPDIDFSDPVNAGTYNTLNDCLEPCAQKEKEAWEDNPVGPEPSEPTYRMITCASTESDPKKNCVDAGEVTLEQFNSDVARAVIGTRLLNEGYYPDGNPVGDAVDFRWAKGEDECISGDFCQNNYFYTCDESYCNAYIDTLDNRNYVINKLNNLCLTPSKHMFDSFEECASSCNAWTRYSGCYGVRGVDGNLGCGSKHVNLKYKPDDLYVAYFKKTRDESTGHKLTSYYQNKTDRYRIKVNGTTDDWYLQKGGWKKINFHTDQTTPCAVEIGSFSSVDPKTRYAGLNTEYRFFSEASSCGFTVYHKIGDIIGDNREAATVTGAEETYMKFAGGTWDRPIWAFSKFQGDTYLTVLYKKILNRGSTLEAGSPQNGTVLSDPLSSCRDHEASTADCPLTNAPPKLYWYKWVNSIATWAEQNTYTRQWADDGMAYYSAANGDTKILWTRRVAGECETIVSGGGIFPQNDTAWWINGSKPTSSDRPGQSTA